MLFKHTLESIEVCTCILNSLVYYVLFNGVNVAPAVDLVSVFPTDRAPVDSLQPIVDAEEKTAKALYVKTLLHHLLQRKRRRQ